MLEEMGRTDELKNWETPNVEIEVKGPRRDPCTYRGFALRHDQAINVRCTTGLLLREDIFAFEAQLYPPEQFGYAQTSPVSKRPPVVVLVGGYTIIAVHAVANPNAAITYNKELIECACHSTGNSPMIVGGDFNVEPDTLFGELEAYFGDNFRDNFSIAKPGEPTHQGGGCLDYFVYNVEGCVTCEVAQEALAGSDHLAVIADFERVTFKE